MITFIRFVFFYAKALLVSNLYVAYDVVTPKHRMHPGVVSVPLRIKGDFSLLLLTNLISMTPGTLCLDVSQDRKQLFIHAMYINDPETFRNEIVKTFEKYVMEIFD